MQISNFRAIPPLAAVLCLLAVMPAAAQTPPSRQTPAKPLVLGKLEVTEADKRAIAARGETRTDRAIDALATKVAAAIDALDAEKDKAAKDKASETLDELSEDPITLRALARHLSTSDKEKAKRVFRRSLEKEAINQFDDLAGTPYAAALTLEFAGEYEASRAEWRKAWGNDPLSAYVHLTRFSSDPERERLLRELRGAVAALAEAAARGEAPPIYITRTGEKRPLVRLSNADALARIEAGEGLRYAYVETLDLTGKTFPKSVSCNRCVVGELKGYDSTFEDKLSFRGFVLRDLHIGKSWTGKVNRSRSIPPAKFNKLLLDKVVVFGDLKMDSVHVTGPTASVFLTVVDGVADLRNSVVSETMDLRFTSVGGELNLQGAELRGAGYFSELHAGGLDLTRMTATKNPMLFDSAELTGPVTVARCELVHGATFENSAFHAPVSVHHCDVGARFNLSRSRFYDKADLTYLELDDIELFGVQAAKPFRLADSVVHGNARLAVDGLNRRLHLDSPHPLHRLYKQYQGDIDSDDELTSRSQYGVTHVDDLAARFAEEVSFANTIFEQFVGFEGVVFGTAGKPALANFYNTQLYGESHFERTTFHALADFRTISGNEISFNKATFERGWLLDDANVTGRLSLSGVELADGATLSFYGARLAFFGVTIDALRDGERSKLFHQQCALNQVELAAVKDDPRMLDAAWDEASETWRKDEAEITRRAGELCLDRTIGEFVVLRDSFTKRGMTEEADWAYWHLRHYHNRRNRERGTVLSRAAAWGQWVLFEKAFGWGVRLQNLLWSSLFVILVYMFLIRLFCGGAVVDWDDETISVADLPIYAIFVISLQSFLGRARDWKSKSTNKVWKVLYTTEMILGIIMITFFIGAYARIILR